MEYNSDKEIWYTKEELYLNPLYIDDFEKYLSKGISKRVIKIKDDCHLLQKEMHKSEPYRINCIINCNYYKTSKKDYASFITGTILYDIITSANKVLLRKKSLSLPETITRFWIIFGDEYDLHEFMKRIYDNFCLILLSDKQSTEQTDIIQDLFFADASFSFIYGQAKIENRDINEKPKEKERRALVSAIKYTWSIISDDVCMKFKNSFDHDNLNSPYYLNNSKDIKGQIKQWCEEVLLPYLNDKREELKNDSIANIGYCVHNLMEMLFEKRNIDNNYILNKSDNNLESVLSKSDKCLLDCAKDLEKSQRTYFNNLREHELEVSMAESVEESKNYELEGDYFQIGTNDIISFDDSGKTFEELIIEAVKTCRNKGLKR